MRDFRFPPRSTTKLAMLWDTTQRMVLISYRRFGTNLSRNVGKELEQKRNVMAHAQKPDLVFQRNGRVHLYWRRCQFSRLLAAEVCASAVVMLDRPCPIQCKTVGYPLHSPFFPSLLHPCVSVCHHIPFPLYHRMSSFIYRSTLPLC